MWRRKVHELASVLRGKAASRSGETLVETLTALLIAGLALLMLAMSIAVASNLLRQGETAAQAYYAANETLAQAGPSASASSATVSVVPAAGNPCAPSEVSVKYEDEAMPGGETGVVYWSATNGS